MSFRAWNALGGRREAIGYTLLATAVAVFVIARALLVPMVHDECASVLWFVQPGEWLPDRSHWDANNHFLSTGIGVWLYRAFGSGMAALRAGSIAAFSLYAWAAWRLGSRLNDARVRWCFWSGMLLCPFVLDFFSMFRGYGPALAGTMVALDGALRYAINPRMRFLLHALLGCCLGGAAIVALVPLWGIVIATLVTLAIGHGSLVGNGRLTLHVATITLLGVVPFAYAVGISLRLREMGLLYHGSLDGFTRVTIASLARYVLGSDAWPVLLLILVGSMLTLAMVVSTARRKGFAAPLVLVACVLMADVSARVLLAEGFRVNYPEDRAGIHFVPLFILAFAWAVDSLAAKRQVLGWVCLPLLFLPARSLWTANLDHCLLWPEQCVPDRFMERIAEEERALGRPVLLGAYHQCGLAIPFAARANRIGPWSVQATDFPEGPHDLRIVDRRSIDRARSGYDVLDSSAGPGLWLLRRSRYEAPAVVSRLAVRAWSGVDEFHDLAALDTGLLRSRPTWVEVRVPLAFSGSSPDISCVVQVSDSTGRDLRYEALQPCVLRPDWCGDTLRFVRSLPTMPTAVRGVVYLYDPKRIAMSVGEGAVTIMIPGP